MKATGLFVLSPCLLFMTEPSVAQRTTPTVVPVHPEDLYGFPGDGAEFRFLQAFLWNDAAPDLKVGRAIVRMRFSCSTLWNRLT